MKDFLEEKIGRKIKEVTFEELEKECLTRSEVNQVIETMSKINPELCNLEIMLKLRPMIKPLLENYPIEDIIVSLKDLINILMKI